VSGRRDSVRGKSEGIRVAVVGVGYWGSRNLRVPRSATGIVSVITVDPPFTRIGNEGQETDHGVTIYPRIEDASPHAEAVIIATPPASHEPPGMVV